MYFQKIKHYLVKSNVPEEPYTIEIGKANVTREGDDLTIVAIGKMVAVAEETADRLEKITFQ